MWQVWLLVQSGYRCWQSEGSITHKRYSLGKFITLKPCKMFSCLCLPLAVHRLIQQTIGQEYRVRSAWSRFSFCLWSGLPKWKWPWGFRRSTWGTLSSFPRSFSSCRKLALLPKVLKPTLTHTCTHSLPYRLGLSACMNTGIIFICGVHKTQDLLFFI